MNQNTVLRNFDSLITPRELATRLGMSLRFVQKHIADGRLPGTIKCGRYWRFDPRTIEKAIISGNILVNNK